MPASTPLRLVLPKLWLPRPPKQTRLLDASRHTRPGRMVHLAFPASRSVTLITRQAWPQLPNLHRATYSTVTHHYRWHHPSTLGDNVLLLARPLTLLAAIKPVRLSPTQGPGPSLPRPALIHHRIWPTRHWVLTPTTTTLPSPFLPITQASDTVPCRPLDGHP